jgi:HPt (histidine-containing phosphotransfer) domain-containing protein
VSDRLDRYFAQEASEYLDQLDELLAAAGRPDLEQLLRLSRGVRGSAQMAGAESVATIAERLEDGIRSVQDNHVSWSAGIRQLTQQTVADLKVLVRASGRWGEVEETRVRSAIERWEEVEAPSGPPAPEIDPGGQSELPASDGRPRGKSAALEVGLESLCYDDAGPNVLTPDRENEMNQPTAAAVPQPVPIESLLLDRDGALQEALAMRDTLERMMREVPGGEVELSSVVRELFELLEIAAAGVASPG